MTADGAHARQRAAACCVGGRAPAAGQEASDAAMRWVRTPGLRARLRRRNEARQILPITGCPCWGRGWPATERAGPLQQHAVSGKGVHMNFIIWLIVGGI